MSQLQLSRHSCGTLALSAARTRQEDSRDHAIQNSCGSLRLLPLPHHVLPPHRNRHYTQTWTSQLSLFNCSSHTSSTTHTSLFALFSLSLLTMRATILLLAAAVLASFIPSTSAATRGPWQDVVVLDCAQNLHILPGHQLFRTSLNAAAATQLYTYVVNTIRNRVSCHCPSISSAELAQSFNADFGSFLRAVETNQDNSTSRTRCGLQASMDEFGIAFAQPLGSSCTYAQWAAGSPCLLEVPVPNFDISLQVALQQCPSSAGQTNAFPYVSLTCSGKACSDLLVPCSTNADCVQSSCTSIAPGTTAASVNSALSSFFDSVSLFPQTEQDSACPAKYNSSTVGTNQLNALMATLQEAILPYATQHGALNLSFCGIDQFVNNGISIQDILAIDWTDPTDIWQSLQYLAFNNIYQFGPLTQFISSLPSPIMTFVVEAGVMLGDLISPVANQVATLFGTTTYMSTTRANWTVPLKWNGLLDSGELVTSAARLAGSEFPTVAAPTITALTASTSYVPLLTTTCDLVVSVLPAQTGGISIRLPNIQVALQAAGARLSDIASCRNSALSASQVNTFFNPASVQWWLNLFTVAVGSGQAPFANAPDIPTPAAQLYAVLNTLALNAPTTCTLSVYTATGQCAGEYDGFDGLFGGLDLALRWTLTSCSAYPNGLPALNLQCVGTDCATFFSASQIKACTQDSGCTAPSTCTLVSKTLLPTPFSSLLFTQTDNTCDNSNKNALDVVNYARTYLGLATQTLAVTSNSTLGYCSMRFQQTVISNPSQWTANLTQTFPTNNTFSLNGLTSYGASSSGGSNTTTGSSTGSAASSTGTNPASLPANSAEVSFIVTLPSNPATDFASLLLMDVAVDMADAYNSSVGLVAPSVISTAFITGTQVLPYLEIIGLVKSATSQAATFSFYVLGTVTTIDPTESAMDLSVKVANDVQTGNFSTYNSQAVVPPGQTVTIAGVNTQKSGAATIQSYNVFVLALLAGCTLAAMWAL